MTDPLDLILAQARAEQIISQPDADALRQLATRMNNPQLAGHMAADLHARTLAVLRPIAAREPALRDALYRISRHCLDPVQAARDALRYPAQESASAARDRCYADAWTSVGLSSGMADPVGAPAARTAYDALHLAARVVCRVAKESDPVELADVIANLERLVK